MTRPHPWENHDDSCDCHIGICRDCGCTNEYIAASPSVTEPETPAAPDLYRHWMKKFGEVASIVCECGEWQWDGYGDQPAILLSDPFAQHSWLRHVVEAEAAAHAARPAEAQAGAGIDVRRIEMALIDAEGDDQIGTEYTPRRLAEYLYNALFSSSLPTEPEG